MSFTGLLLSGLPDPFTPGLVADRDRFDRGTLSTVIHDGSDHRGHDDQPRPTDALGLFAGRCSGRGADDPRSARRVCGLAAGWILGRQCRRVVTASGTTASGPVSSPQGWP